MMQYTFRCDICDAEFERFIDAQELAEKEVIVHLYREFPANWSFVHGITVCSKHIFTVNNDGFFVDGKLIKSLIR